MSDASDAADHWIARMVRAARAGAPSLRTLLSAKVELKVTIGSSREGAQGASIVSEWLAGRFAVAPQFELVALASKGPRVAAQLHLGGDAAYPAAWHLEALLGPDGLAREISVRIQGSA
jgi:hypothetical protein